MDSLRKAEGFVVGVGRNGDCYARVYGIPQDVLVAKCHVPPGPDLFGQWIELTISPGSTNGSFYACATVIPIADVFRSRIFDRKAEVLVKMQHDGFSRGFEVFFHKFFGLICDARNIIPVVERGSWYWAWITSPARVREVEPGNSYWEVSHHLSQPTLDVGRRMSLFFDGIVIRRTPTDGYLIWTTANRGVFMSVEKDRCPTTENLLGRWIKVIVDRGVVRGSLISDKNVVSCGFKTELVRRRGRDVVEVLSNFKYMVNRSVFHSEFFGIILDSIESPIEARPNAVYKAWITPYGSESHPGVRWEVAPRQTYIGVNEHQVCVYERIPPSETESDVSHFGERFPSGRRDNFVNNGRSQWSSNENERHSLQFDPTLLQSSTLLQSLDAQNGPSRSESSIQPGFRNSFPEPRISRPILQPAPEHQSNMLNGEIEVQEQAENVRSREPLSEPLPQIAEHVIRFYPYARARGLLNIFNGYYWPTSDQGVSEVSFNPLSPSLLEERLSPIRPRLTPPLIPDIRDLETENNGF